MSTLTIYGLDRHLEQAIHARAAQQQQSVNQWIVETLQRILESDQESGLNTYHDLDHLAGGWSQEEAEKCFQDIQIFENIDEDVWQ